MWFSSIWIFTLDLPWQLGANFFMKYLRDGDPASNILMLDSWFTNERKKLFAQEWNIKNLLTKV